MMDEPVSFHDINYKLGFFEIVKLLSKKEITAIMFRDESELAGELSDAVICIKDGDVRCLGLVALCEILRVSCRGRKKDELKAYKEIVKPVSIIVTPQLELSCCSAGKEGGLPPSFLLY